MRRHSLLNCALIGVLTLTCCAASWAQPASAYEALWYLNGQAKPGLKVTLNVDGERESPADKLTTWRCSIEAKINYANALVGMSVRTPEGKEVLHGQQEIPLLQGANRCTFDLDPQALAPGSYIAEFRVEATAKEPPAVFTAHIRRVSSADLAQRLDAAVATVSKMASPEDTTKPSYTSLRVRIAADFGAKAPQDAAAGNWRAYAEKVDYVSKVAGGAGADVALSNLLPEVASTAEDLPLASVRADNGGYAGEGKPVFLIGAAVDAPEGAQLLKRYGLNYGVVTIQPSDALTPGADKDLNAAYGALFGALANANLASSVELAAGVLAGWPLERWPDAQREGFVNLAREDVQALVSRHVKAVLPFVKAQRGIVGVGLLNNPKFKFEGDRIHRQFIEQVETMYPDRQKLNALWASHLASFEDITMWGHFVDGRADKKIPEYHYENKRAYTFDFTAYHLGLVAEYLNGLAAEARTVAPDLPLTVTLPDTAFDKGETTYSPDRENVARSFDYTSCTLGTGAADPVYGLAYPHTSAVLTLLQSFDRTKPVNVERLDIPLDDTMDATAMYDYVQSAVWNAVIDGADALALAPESPIFAHPAALEAYSAAALDINRLAPTVLALQQAPTDVAILYSDSSKILDAGDPHLKSCSFAYEGASFSGLTVRFLSERQATEDKLEPKSILVLPQTPALRGETFAKLESFVDGGGVAARVGSPIPYDEHGRSRTSVLRNTGKTVIVRGFNLPTEYLHAMDGVQEFSSLPDRPRPINAHGYPLEGIKTRYVEVGGVPYLYVVNLRKQPINCFLSGNMQAGRDLLRGREVSFPTYVEPLHPMLIQLDANLHRTTVAPVATEKKRHR